MKGNTNSTENVMRTNTTDEENEGEGDRSITHHNQRLMESPKTIALFVIFGFVVCFLAGVVLTSAQDILKQDFREHTGIVWIVYTVPFLLFTGIVAWIFDRVSTIVIVGSFFPLMLIGTSCLALGEALWMKLLGVFLIGTVDCVSEVTAVALTAYFDRITVMAFCIGSGVSYVLGPLYYTAMTSWFEIHPRVVLLTLVIHPMGFLGGYLLLEPKRKAFRSSSFLSMDDEILERAGYLSTKAKCLRTLLILPKILQMFLSFTLNDMVVSGVITSLAFKNSPFSPADHYKYYLISSFGGLCLGRSYLGLVEVIKPGWADKVLIRRTWVLVALTTGHMVFLFLASLYRFLPNVWITMTLVFSLGFFSEATYVNISVIFGELEDYRVRELSLGMSVYGIGLGNLIGSVISEYIEEPLVIHCIRTVTEKELCFTRVGFKPG